MDREQEPIVKLLRSVVYKRDVAENNKSFRSSVEAHIWKGRVDTLNEIIRDIKIFSGYTMDKYGDLTHRDGYLTHCDGYLG